MRLKAYQELLDTVERIRAGANPALEIEGVVLTMLDERTNLAQQVMAELKRFFGRQALRDDHPAKHSAGGGAQSWQAGAGL